MANNKARGKYFEDKVAEIIRKEFKLSKNQVHRNYESGMAHGEFGDIRTPFDIIIECKYYKTIDIEKLLFNKPKMYIDWLDQLYNETTKFYNEFNKYPIASILVFSKPRSEIYCLVLPFDNKLSKLSEYDKSYKIKLNNYEPYLLKFKDFIKILKEEIGNA